MLHERRPPGERISASGAEEVPFVVSAAARQHAVPFDGCAAAGAARGEELVVVEVAVEPRAELLLPLILVLVLLGIGGMLLLPRGELGSGLWVEGDVLERGPAVLAREAGRVEVGAGGVDGTA